MAESAASLVDEAFPGQPVRQWVLSAPYPVRFICRFAPHTSGQLSCSTLRFCLFASRPEFMGRVLGIVYRCFATQLIKKAGFSRKIAQTGAVTLIQRFGSALNLEIYFLWPAFGCSRLLQAILSNHWTGIVNLNQYPEH